MISIAIDGPSGSGKSTIAKILSKRLGYVNVDTGALYRALALYMIENNINFRNELLVSEALSRISISIENCDGVQKTFLNGVDVSYKLRNKNVSEMSSKIASYNCVREFLLGIQRKIAGENDVVMDGRDIGTVVLPNASVKIFLDASPNIRAIRRFNQMRRYDKRVMYDDVLNAIKKRDFNDKNRKISPLKIAEDAVILDNSKLSLNKSVEKILEIIREKVDVDNEYDAL